MFNEKLTWFSKKCFIHTNMYLYKINGPIKSMFEVLKIALFKLFGYYTIVSYPNRFKI